MKILITSLTATLGFAALLTACGSAATPTSTATVRIPTPTPIAALGAEYLALVAPSNTALDALNKAGTPTATMASVKPALRAYLAALTTFNNNLVQFQANVPAAAQSDVHSLRQELSAEIADLTALVNDTTDEAFLSHGAAFRADATKFGGTANLVRSDLGLAPAS